MIQVESIRKIKSIARSLGFENVGVTGIYVQEASKYLFGWLKKGYHGEMGYMLNSPERRTNLKIRYPWARSIICVLKNYYKNLNNNMFAHYAYYRDYHFFLKERLQLLANLLEKDFGAKTKICVDSAPIMEKPFASRAGLGWIGKNSLLLSKKGSYFFLGEIITDLELEADMPYRKNYCGSCALCIESCPTKAIVSPYVLDSRRCISYLTIEYKGVIDKALRPSIGRMIFGCDICQQVCPWNECVREAHDLVNEFRYDLATTSLASLMYLSGEDFDKKFKDSVISRLKREHFLRNVAIALGNSGSKDAIEPLKKGLFDESWLVRLHSAWGLGQIRGSACKKVLEQRLKLESDERVRNEIQGCL